jgi:hypothetical protein
MPDRDDDQLSEDHVNIRFNGGDPVVNIDGLGCRSPREAMKLANAIARAVGAIRREQRIRTSHPPRPVTTTSVWEYMRSLAEAGMFDEDFDVEPYLADFTIEAEASRRQPNLVRFVLAVVDTFEQTHSDEVDRVRTLIEHHFNDRRRPL